MANAARPMRIGIHNGELPGRILHRTMPARHIAANIGNAHSKIGTVVNLSGWDAAVAEFSSLRIR
jgi:glutamate synthase domain-containing protein 1